MEGRMDSKTYGDFAFVPDELVPEAQLALTLSPSELTAHWLRCGQVSDFVAGYIASAYAAEHRTTSAPLFTSISTVFQELIENAAKFSRKRESSISVRVKHFSRVLMFEVESVTTPAFAQRFEEYLEQMERAEDLGAVYMEIVEAQTESPAEVQRSGIGLLVLRKDHEVRLGVRFASDEAGRPTITVRAFQTLEGV
jgi:hypothetical protein